MAGRWHLGLLLFTLHFPWICYVDFFIIIKSIINYKRISMVNSGKMKGEWRFYFCGATLCLNKRIILYQVNFINFRNTLNEDSLNQSFTVALFLSSVWIYCMKRIWDNIVVGKAVLWEEPFFHNFIQCQLPKWAKL